MTGKYNRYYRQQISDICIIIKAGGDRTPIWALLVTLSVMSVNLTYPSQNICYHCNNVPFSMNSLCVDFKLILIF